MEDLWMPGAAPPVLVQRSRLYSHIRGFFSSRNVLEVETPLLCSSTATDPHLASMGVQQGEQPYFLQTSPEFAMKRLLAAGSGPIYQICKAFRNDEQGPFHNPEFTMVEWYRPGFVLEELIAEISALVQFLASEFGVEGWDTPKKASYQQVFEDQFGINPHRATTPELAEIASGRLDFSGATLNRDGWLNLLMGQVVEPALGPGPVFVYIVVALVPSSCAGDGVQDLCRPSLLTNKCS